MLQFQSMSHTKLLVFIIVTIKFGLVRPLKDPWCGQRSLIVMSIDGFKPSYVVSSTLTPFFHSLKKKGSWSDNMSPIVPTTALPNHHSIATGLYPAFHGVLGNEIYDPASDEIETNLTKIYSKTAVEPIWTTNERMGGVSACMMWPGCDIPYRSIMPTYFTPYNASKTCHQRIDEVIVWVNQSKLVPNLVLIYCDEIDSTSHSNGTTNNEFLKAIRQADDDAGYLYDYLRRLSLLNDINVIYVSDHGTRTLEENDLIDIGNDFRYVGSSSFLQVIPNNEIHGQVLLSRFRILSQDGSFTFYESTRVPSRWVMKHDKNEMRTIFLVGNQTGFTVVHEDKKKKRWGTHGFDNSDPEMTAFFMAVGPMIKESFEVAKLQILDLYILFCTILDIPPAPNNGSMKAAGRMLQGHQEDLTSCQKRRETFLSLVCCLSSIFLVAKVSF